MFYTQHTHTHNYIRSDDSMVWYIIIFSDGGNVLYSLRGQCNMCVMVSFTAYTHTHSSFECIFVWIGDENGKENRICLAH